jgi:alkylated DNA repair dioxygenase AlkB
MIEQALFSLGTAQYFDVGRTGGLPVAVDRAFSTLERIQLDDTSWVERVPGWLRGDEDLMQLLMDEASWEQRSRWMYTRMVEEPRLTAEHPVIADAPQPVLHYLADALAAHYEQPFSRLWMNWYRDNNDGTGWHADRPANNQVEAIIPVLSLGATRRFSIRPAAGGPSRTIVAHGGDLVVMGGRCQKGLPALRPEAEADQRGPHELELLHRPPRFVLRAIRAAAASSPLPTGPRGARRRLGRLVTANTGHPPRRHHSILQGPDGSV